MWKREVAWGFGMWCAWSWSQMGFAYIGVWGFGTVALVDGHCYVNAVKGKIDRVAEDKGGEKWRMFH